MNSLQFAQGISPWLATGDVQALSMNELMVLTNAMNKALATWADKVPAGARIRPLEFTLPAPRTITVTTTAGSAVLTSPSPALTAADAGRTIKLGNDTADNRLNGTGTALTRPAAVSGSTTATVFGDSYLLPETLQFVRGPVLLRADVDTWVELTPAAWELQPMRLFLSGATPAAWRQRREGEVGRHTFRVDALPDRDYPISAKQIYEAKRWTIGDWNTARTLDLEDTHWNWIEGLVVRNLLGLGLLKKDVNVALVRENAVQSETELASTPLLETGGGVILTTRPGF